jgi:hypothetical protein
MTRELKEKILAWCDNNILTTESEITELLAIVDEGIKNAFTVGKLAGRDRPCPYLHVKYNN